MRRSSRGFTRVGTASVLTLAVLSSLMLGAAPAEASVGVGLSPVVTDAKVKPGSRRIVDLQVYNQTKRPLAVSTEVHDIRVDRHGVVGEVPEGDENPWSAAPWIKPEPTRFTVPVGSWRPVRVAVTVPRDAAPGGHYAGVFFTSRPATATGEMVESVVRISHTFLLQVRGPVVRRAAIERLEMPKLVLGNQARPRLLLRNTGTVHVSARGSVSFESVTGTTVARVPIRKIYVLPKKTRVVELPLGKLPVAGPLRARADVEFSSIGRRAMTDSTFLLRWWLLLLPLLVPVWLLRRRIGPVVLAAVPALRPSRGGEGAASVRRSSRERMPGLPQEEPVTKPAAPEWAAAAVNEPAPPEITPTVEHAGKIDTATSVRLAPVHAPAPRATRKGVTPRRSLKPAAGTKATRAAKPAPKATRAARPAPKATRAAKPARKVTRAAKPARKVTRAAKPAPKATRAARPARRVSGASRPPTKAKTAVKVGAPRRSGRKAVPASRSARTATTRAKRRTRK